MKYQVEYSDDVRFDLARFAEFLSKWDNNDTADVFEAIERSIETLTVNPYLGPVLRHRNRRELIVGRSTRGSMVRYTIDEARNVVLVLGIRGQRDLGFHGRA